MLLFSCTPFELSLASSLSHFAFTLHFLHEIRLIGTVKTFSSDKIVIMVVVCVNKNSSLHTSDES